MVAAPSAGPVSEGESAVFLHVFIAAPLFEAVSAPEAPSAWLDAVAGHGA
jgi:hypothetical protein